MSMISEKEDIIRRLTGMVAESLDDARRSCHYARFNDCYDEVKEIKIEWLEMLLHKLTCIEKGNFPRIGYLAHVGRLLDTYTTRYGIDANMNLYYKEYFVADGTLAEAGITDLYREGILVE